MPNHNFGSEKDLEKEKLMRSVHAAQIFFKKKKQEDPSPPETQAQPEPEPEKEKPKAKLLNLRFETNEGKFQEKIPVAVNLKLPEELNKFLKVDFELLAITHAGDESISKGEGKAEDGIAKSELPAYYPTQTKDGKQAEECDYFVKATHRHAEPVNNKENPITLKGKASPFLDSVVLDGITFETNSSFILPENAAAIQGLEEAFKRWKKIKTDAKVAIFGHADKVGSDEDNKPLSERRAESVKCFLLKDAEGFDQLYQAENWGIKSVQAVLDHLGFEPGPVDGKDGPKTQAGVERFQKSASISETGNADPKTRDALWKTYMDNTHNEVLKEKDLISIDGKPFMGCSEFNPLNNQGGDSKANRRVSFILLKHSKEIPVTFPCKHQNISPCNKQIKKNTDTRRTKTYQCAFYDEIVEKENPGKPGVLPGGKFKLTLELDCEYFAPLLEKVKMNWKVDGPKEDIEELKIHVSSASDPEKVLHKIPLDTQDKIEGEVEWDGSLKVMSLTNALTLNMRLMS